MMNNLMNDDLAQAHFSGMKDAQQFRRGHRHVAARRLSRKAEQAARQARLALARAS